MGINTTDTQAKTSSSWRTLPIASPAQTRRAILRSLATREYRWWLICAGFAQTITVIAQLLPAQIVGWSINQLSSPQASNARSTMLWLLFFTNALLVVGVILFFSKYILLSNFARNTRIKLVHNALNIPANIIEHAGTGDLLSRDSSDVEKIIEAVENLLGNLIGFVLYLVIILILATITSPLLTLAALAGAISYYPGLQWYRHRSHNAYLQESAANSSIYQQLAITVDGAHTIDTFMLHDLRRESLFRALVNHFQKTLMVTFIRQVFIFSIELGLFLPILGWLLFSFWGYQHHWFTLGAITTIGIYFFQMIYPIESLLYWSDQAQSAFSSFSRVTGIEIIAQPIHPIAPSHLHNEQPAVLIAHKVSFHYPETQKPALTEIDLTIHPGERIAIVGPSGAGKTTLAKLLSGFDFPTSGHITFAGVPLHDIPPAQLRRYISLVTQEHHVFIGTIIENVRMARSDASDDEVLLALETVGAMQWVAHVGINTLVGDGRYELSAAQAQQIALARVALANPHIVILDEATSLLDPQSAYNAEHGLADIIASRTVITIAHRLYSAQVADRIAVMEHGTITELGTHHELLADNKTYARLWSAWNFH